MTENHEAILNLKSTLSTWVVGSRFDRAKLLSKNNIENNVCNCSVKYLLLSHNRLANKLSENFTNLAKQTRKNCSQKRPDFVTCTCTYLPSYSEKVCIDDFILKNTILRANPTKGIIFLFFFLETKTFWGNVNVLN